MHRVPKGVRCRAETIFETMASPIDRFTRLQKIAIFLIAMGPEKSREILGDFDLETIESINAAMQSLKGVTPQEKAATMIEFGDFFYKDKPLSTKLKESAKKAPKKKVQKKTKRAQKEKRAQKTASRRALSRARRKNHRRNAGQAEGSDRPWKNRLGQGRLRLWGGL